MARLAFAIDSSIDIGELAYGYGVDPALALVMAAHLGKDVLVYRIAEMQGGYFGIARLSSISDLVGTNLHTVVFDDIRMFLAEIPYPVGVTTLTRLQLLDAAEFEAIVGTGMPVPVPAGMMEPRQPFRYDAPTVRDVGGMMARAREAAHGICALTGEVVGAALQLAVIWPKGMHAGLTADNFLPLSPAACVAFESGHLSARDDLGVLVDMSQIDRRLVERINRSGRLIVSDDPAMRPAPENLAYHRRFRFRLG
jgi:hypothetical protein